MNISTQIFYNDTEVEISLARTAVDVIIVLLGFPINSYVIGLIVTGIGNGLAAEFFSLNVSVCEMFFYMNCLFDIFSFKDDISTAVTFFNAIAFTGHPLFQSLICAERYLAVVHPVIFLKSKPLRYRLICCIIAWLATFLAGGIGVMLVFMHKTYIYFQFIIVHFSIFICIQLFCLVAVLRALKQSGPGEKGRQRNENLMKRRAFYHILITTLTMLFIFFLDLILMNLSSINSLTVVCVGYVCFALAGLVQPLHFLYRVEKLPFINIIVSNV